MLGGASLLSLNVAQESALVSTPWPFAHSLGHYLIFLPKCVFKYRILHLHQRMHPCGFVKCLETLWFPPAEEVKGQQNCFKTKANPFPRVVLDSWYHQCHLAHWKRTWVLLSSRPLALLVQQQQWNGGPRQGRPRKPRSQNYFQNFRNSCYHLHFCIRVYIPMGIAKNNIFVTFRNKAHKGILPGPHIWQQVTLWVSFLGSFLLHLVLCQSPGYNSTDQTPWQWWLFPLNTSKILPFPLPVSKAVWKGAISPFPVLSSYWSNFFPSSAHPCSLCRKVQCSPFFFLDYIAKSLKKYARTQ